ncbi:MAG: type II toxin-antitoxin system RelE/ParE family toxin [Candidatus Hydrogenedentes bacterium]|nr:type II toxin-antitoxin system RelE/ParE family toxin [Candidatus Hydrogenedentota bacterium]
MGRYRLTPSAREDIRNILRRSVENWGKPHATKYTEKLSDCLTRIGNNDIQCRRIDEIPELYMARCEPHNVFFLRGKPNQVVAILHERMDCLKHLKERLSS